jgi:hypothetical protein
VTMTEAEGRDIDTLARGGQVFGHPGSCAVLLCSHGILWHGRHGKRPCTVPGCHCRGLLLYMRKGPA